MCFATKPISLVSALQRLYPTPSAVPLLAPQMINLRAGASALMGFLASVGSPSVDPTSASFPAEVPFALFLYVGFTTDIQGNLKVCSIDGLAVSLLKRAPTYLTFPTD